MWSSSRLTDLIHGSGLLDASSGTHIYTDGANGAYWRRGRTPWMHVPHYHIDMVDAGGAGDWMTAALLDAMSSLVPDEVEQNDLAGPLRYAQAVARAELPNVGGTLPRVGIRA